MKRNTAQVHQWNIADTITSVRIAAALLMLFLPLRSAGFLAIYTIAGLTDALDGWLARKTGVAGDFGARLDSITDLLFCAVLLLRLFPVLWQTLPAEIWHAAAGILFVRLVACGVAAIKYRRVAFLHTRLNKLTGAAIFLLPYVIAVSAGVVYSRAVCLLAFAAAFEELAIHLCRKEYRADRKSIFQKENGDL